MLKKSLSLFLVGILLTPLGSSALLLEDLDESAESTEPLGISLDLPIPEIVKITIDEKKEHSEAEVTLRGKNFLIPDKEGENVSLEVTFQSVDSEETSVNSFSYQDNHILVFLLPKDVSGGNVTVRLSSGDRESISDPFPFEFHPPKILFITGDDGIAPGKKIRLWGEYFDGIHFNVDGKSLFEDWKNGDLIEGDGKTQSVKKNLSSLDITLPEKNFQKEFWIERNCDGKGENCLESNHISFEQALSPMLRESAVNYQKRTATLWGHFFPQNVEDFSVFLDGEKLTILSENEEGKLRDDDKVEVKLPCPLPPVAEFHVEYKGQKSNFLSFIPPSSPEIIEVEIEGAERPGRVNLRLSAQIQQSNIQSDTCDAKPTLFLGTKEYTPDFFGGNFLVKDILFEDLPEQSEFIVEMDGIYSSPYPFFREEFVKEPRLYRIESKYGFKPGVPFAIYGNYLGNQYLACGEGFTKISGVSIQEEETHMKIIGKDENGQDITEEDCIRNPPEVTRSTITGQFSMDDIEKTTASGTKTITVSVDGKQSNSIEIPFGYDQFQKNAYTTPLVTSIEYPEGHLPGDMIKIYGIGFGAKPEYNEVLVGGKKMKITKTSRYGTFLKGEIPETEGTDMTIFRKTPSPQTSEAFSLIILPFEKKEISLNFLEEEDEEIYIKQRYSFSEDEGNTQQEEQELHFGTIKLVNSLAKMKVNTLRFLLHFEEENPENPLSMASLKAVSLGNFHLKYNGTEIPLPAFTKISYQKEEIMLIFHNIEIDPTISEEGDTFEVVGSVLPNIREKTTFQLSFDPNKESSFSGYIPEFEKNAQPKGRKTQSKVITVFPNEEKKCISFDEKKDYCHEFRLFETKEEKRYAVAPEVSSKSDGTEKTLALTLQSDRYDDDRDGLTNAEEKLIGSDPQKSDSDKDGYSDFLEVEFGYSPVSKDINPLFSDLNGTETSAITRLFLFGIFDAEEEFRPEEGVSRALFFHALQSIFSLGEADITKRNPFSDISSNDWFYNSALEAKQKGVFLEKGFRPFAIVKRGEACQMALRYAGFSYLGDRKKKSAFADVQKKNAGWIEACVAKKLLIPEQEKIFGFRSKLSAKEMSVLLLRLALLPRE